MTSTQPARASTFNIACKPPVVNRGFEGPNPQIRVRFSNEGGGWVGPWAFQVVRTALKGRFAGQGPHSGPGLEELPDSKGLGAYWGGILRIRALLCPLDRIVIAFTGKRGQVMVY